MKATMKVISKFESKLHMQPSFAVLERKSDCADKAWHIAEPGKDNKPYMRCLV